MSVTDRELDREYILGQRRLFQAHDSFPLLKLVREIKENTGYQMVNLDAPLEWDEIQKSKLIESIFINIPLIPLVFWEIDYNQYKLIDGLKRIKTFVDFYDDKLTLNGLEFRKDLNGLKYSELPQKDKDFLARRRIKTINVGSLPEWDANQDEIEQMIKIISTRLGH